MKTNLHLPTLLFAWAIASTTQGAVVLPTVIGSNMVVQSGEPLVIWGWADAGEKITIKLGDAVVAAATGEGRATPWKVKLPAQKPGPVAEIEVAGSNRLTITNVLAGEVWLCSGQSNMVMTLKQKGGVTYGGVLDEDQEVATATDQLIRFYINRGGNDKPLPGSTSGWEICTPENAPHFSAVGYFFARKLRAELKTPVGIMPLAAGGQPAEFFTPARVMDGDADFQAQKKQGQMMRGELGAKAAADRKTLLEYRQALEESKKTGVRPPPPTYQLSAEDAAKLKDYGLILDFGFIYERDIHPVASFPIKGVIWYQGESNATRGDKYGALMTRLIQSWREDWGQPLPFVMVALAGFQNSVPSPVVMTAKGDSFPLVREAIIKVADTIPTTGVVSAVDVGEATNIHPHNKKPVGERAALWTLNHVYGHNVVSNGPGFGKVAFPPGKAVVPLTTNKAGVMLKSPGGFELAGEDRQFFPAKAELKGDTIEVTAAEVRNPVALRYAFLNFPECTVYNSAGLPALPFRTDDWPVKAAAEAQK